MRKQPLLKSMFWIACAVMLNACSSGGGLTPSASSTSQEKAEEARTEEERKKAEKARAEEERKKAEKARAEEERKKAEEARAEEERKKAEKARAEEERKKAEEAAQNNPNTPPKPESGSSFSDALNKGFIANSKNPEKKDYMDYKAVNGIVLSIDNTNGNVTARAPESKHFDELLLNGTKILLLASSRDKLNLVAMRPLRERDFPDGGFNKDGEGLVGSVGDERQGNFQAVRYGVYTVDGKSHLFVQGTPSPWLSTAKYQYSGNAVHGKDGKYSRATTTAVVDFGAKTVDVTITPPSQAGHADPSPLTFGGVIKGNTFSGTKNDIETHGGFFGPGGVDLGGIYHAKEGVYKGYNGAYGASNRQLVK